MIKLHPEFLKKDGEPQFAVLPYDEFLALQQMLEDAEDLLELRKARAEDDGSPGYSIDEARKELGL